MTDKTNLTDRRVALITGAAQGIGAATALEFAGRGYAVAMADCQTEPLAELARQVRSLGGEALPLPGDLADLGFAESAVQAVIDHWNRVDVLVNNAISRELVTMRTITLESWERTIRIGLTVPAFLARWVAEVMQRNRPGVIVNISSMMSHQAAGFSPAYVACKGAIDALTYELAALYGPAGIRVLAINPGAIDTQLSRDAAHADGKSNDPIRQFSQDMIMLQRWGDPAEIARAIAWAASDEASYLTGTTLVIDGGWTRQHLPYSLKHQSFPEQFP